MNKKALIIIVLIAILGIGLIVLTGCGNNNNSKEDYKTTNSNSIEEDKKTELNNNIIKITDKDKGYVTTFDGINNKFEQKKPAYNQVDSEDLGVFISLSYNEYPKSVYDYYKTHNFLGVEFSEGETKDYIWNKYSGYTYSISETEANFKILLEDNEENSIVLVGYVGGQSGKNTNVAKAFDSEDFQSFLNSIEFEKVTE